MTFQCQSGHNHWCLLVNTKVKLLRPYQHISFIHSISNTAKVLWQSVNKNSVGWRWRALDGVLYSFSSQWHQMAACATYVEWLVWF